MGTYLNKPNKEKHTKFGENERFRFVASGMQGWRTSDEDA